MNPDRLRFGSLPHEPCVYVVELSTGVIKIGASTSARARLKGLVSSLRHDHDAEFERFEVFTCATYREAFRGETKVVHLLEDVAQNVPGRREFFTGISYEETVRIACEALLVLPPSCPCVRCKSPKHRLKFLRLAKPEAFAQDPRRSTP